MRFPPGRYAIFPASACACVAIVLYFLIQWSPDKTGIKQLAAHRNANVARAFQNLPLHFEPNLGQGREGSAFLTQGSNYQMDLSKDGATISLSKGADAGSDTRVATVSMTLGRSNKNTQLIGEELSEGKVNYLIGDDQSKWLTDIPTYKKVRYKEVYPGIDLVYYGKQTELEFDFIVARGADPRQIRLDFSGAQRLSKDAEGNLLVSLGDGDVVLQRPILYQNSPAGRESVEGEFVFADRDSIRFKVGDYDESRELVIDPVLSYSTFLPGGTTGLDIAVDTDGNAIITGTGSGVPATTGMATGGVFVTKFNATGSNLIFSSRVGTQSGSEFGRALKLDPAGNIVVVGSTSSSNFPSINPVKGKSTFFVSGNGGDSWANPSNLEDFQTYQIAPSFQDPNLVYAAAANRIYRSTNGGASWTNVTNNLPASLYQLVAVNPSSSAQLLTAMSQGLYRSNDGGNSWAQVPGAVLPGMGVAAIQFDPTNGQVIYLASGTGVRKSVDGGQTWSTQNAGLPTNVTLSSLAVDSIDPDVLFVGSTSQGIFKSLDGGANWVAVNSGIVGTASNVIRKLAIDPNNPSNVFVATGNSSNPNLLFKSTNGGLTWSLAYTSSGFGNQEISALAVSRFDSARVYLGILGKGFYRSTDGGAIFTRSHTGMVYNRVGTIVESPLTAGRIYVGTASDTFVNDAFVFKMVPSGNSLIYSSLLGGSDNDSALALAVDAEGNAYVGGTTRSFNFPTLNAFQDQHRSDGAQFLSEDGFVTKIAPNGGTMAYSTYLGGNSFESINALAVDNQGRLAIAGSTQSTDFPLLNSHQPTNRGADAFLTKLSSGGNALEFSTFWGSTAEDSANGLAIDAQGSMVLAGYVTATGLPAVNALQPQYNGGSRDGFITKFSPDGSQVLFSTHLGGKDVDWIQDVDIDLSGNIYVAGTSSSKNFPTVRSAKNPSTYYRSSNRAEKWSNFNDLRSDILDFAFHPTDPQIIFGASNDGLFRTADGGDTWSKVATAPASLGGGFGTVEFDPQNALRIFIGFRDPSGGNPAKIALSTDGGASWNVLPGFSGGSDLPYKIVVSPADPQVVYAATFFSLYKSPDGGITWARATTNELWPVQDFAVNPADPSIVYIARYFSGGGIHRSLDGGANWQQMPLGVGQSEFVVIDPLQPTTVYARSVQGFSKTVDNGENWTPMPFPPTGFRLAVDPFRSNTLYLPVHPTATGTNSGVYRSTDGGANWTKFTEGMPRSADFQRIEPDPRVEGTLHGNMALDTPTNQEAFVAKLSPAGTELIFSSVIGGDVHTGSSTDFAMAVAATPGGTAFLTGGTSSPDFPTTPGAYSRTHNNTTLFVARFDPSWSVRGRITDQPGGENVLGATVTLNGTTSAATATDTDGLGKYVFPNVAENSGFTLVPRKLGYDFTPANYTISSLVQDETLNFTGVYTTYVLQGSITFQGSALANVAVALTGSETGTTTTDANGNFAFTVPKYGDYSVRPALDGYIFAPQQHSFMNVTGNLQANFTARAGYAIGGEVLRNGNPVPGISVALSGSENQTVTTDALGRYSFDAGINGDYSVTPSANGLGFSPISHSFTNLSSNQTGNFTAYRFANTIDSITFVSRPSFNESQLDIFLIDDEGFGLTPLTTTPSTSESQPAWAPNGRKLAYLKTPSGPLHVMDYDGGNDRPLITSVIQISGPDWSPDGRRITFSGLDNTSGLPKIFIANNDGSGIQMITSGPSWDENPNWSPDGAKIVFNRIDKLYTVNPDGSGLQILLNSTLGQSEADWSPDGEEIVFRGANGSSGRIYMVRRDGTNLRRLTNEDTDESSPAWSLDGTRIAYVRGISGNIYTRDTSGGDPKQITSGSEAKHSPAWRPRFRLPAVFDFDGDAKTDIGIYRPSLGEWWYQRSSDGQVPAFQFGSATDKIVPADFTGDRKTDVAIWRPESGTWFVLRSEDFSYYAFPFGIAGDVPVPADYDGDGKADPAIFRPSAGTWYIQRSGDNGTTITPFGSDGDVPVAADYDGDAQADVAIYRPSNGQWWINRTTSGQIAMTFGTGTDKPVPGEYTGDGKFDVAFWRPSTGEWFILRSEDMTYYSVPFGGVGDIPAPGDYDGDGKFDTTVFRPASATWFSERSAAGTLIQQFGAAGDVPIPSVFIP